MKHWIYFCDHPLTIAAATVGSITAMLQLYNAIIGAFVVTCSAILIARKIWKTFKD